MKTTKQKLGTLLATLLLTCTTQAQLTIEQCYEKAEANYPLAQQRGLIEKSEAYSVANAARGYLPQVQITAQATYQSDVTKLPIDIPGVKELSKDQYNAAIELNQSIWDGGGIKARKKSVRTQSAVSKKQLDVNLYTLRERVNQLFFGILLHDEMLRQNAIYIKDLERNLQQISAYAANGLANQSDIDAVRVEQIKTQQDSTLLAHSRKAYAEMLAALIGEDGSGADITITKPANLSTAAADNMRPELRLYDAQLANLDARRMETNASIMPQFGLFARGGYGKPGLNMLAEKFSTYFIGGVSMSWNFGNLYTRRNKLRDIEANKAVVETQRAAFLLNNQLDRAQSSNEAEKIRQLINSDNEVINLRAAIRQAAETKVAEGTMSVLDMMKEVNAEQQAINAKIKHEIELMQAIYNLKYLTNN